MAEHIKKSELMDHIELNAREYGESYDAWQILGDIEDFPAANVVARAAFDQVMWERDIAMEQLKEHGIPFGGEADVVAVVRCKDCIHRLCGGYCKTVTDARATKPVNDNFFCGYGKRRGDDGV